MGLDVAEMKMSAYPADAYATGNAAEGLTMDGVPVMIPEPAPTKQATEGA